MAQAFQMLRNGGLFHLQEHAQIADTHFGPAQRPENTYPGFVGKKLKEIREFR
jgi:hypothetical protein